MVRKGKKMNINKWKSCAVDIDSYHIIRAMGQKGFRREFCKLMMSAKKVYRKEDLLALTNKPVNRG